MSRASSVDDFESDSSDDDVAAQMVKSKSSAARLKSLAASPFKRVRALGKSKTS